jgi:hypothetical protein
MPFINPDHGTLLWDIPDNRSRSSGYCYNKPGPWPGYEDGPSSREKVVKESAPEDATVEVGEVASV